MPDYEIEFQIKKNSTVRIYGVRDLTDAIRMGKAICQEDDNEDVDVDVDPFISFDHFKRIVQESSNGRTPAFEADDEGSNPST